MQPQVLTLPDVVGNWKETVRLMHEFPTADTGVHAERMAVVQQHPEASLFEWTLAYKSLYYRWIALPRILADRRVELIAGLRLLNLWKVHSNHHAFGMNAGSLDELPKLNSLGVYSCDSSAPVWRGLNGLSITSTMPWEDIPFDPYYKADEVFEADCSLLEGMRELADYNLTEVLTACQSRWEIPSIIKAAPISASR